MTRVSTPPHVADRRGLGWDVDSRYSSIMTLVAVATTLVRDARSNTVSVVIGSAGSAARDRAPNARS